MLIEQQQTFSRQRQTCIPEILCSQALARLPQPSHEGTWEDYPQSYCLLLQLARLCFPRCTCFFFACPFIISPCSLSIHYKMCLPNRMMIRSAMEWTLRHQTLSSCRPDMEGRGGVSWFLRTLGTISHQIASKGAFRSVLCGLACPFSPSVKIHVCYLFQTNKLPRRT